MLSDILVGVAIAIVCFFIGFCVGRTEQNTPANWHAHPKAPPRNKPLAGIAPRCIWLETRAEELRDAIARYESAGIKPRTDWRAELRHIEAELMDAPERRMLRL